MLNIFIFFFGAIIGSFANVCIYRLPLEKSIIFPSSFCPHCKNKIKFYHNIPIISYILLSGKCSSCHNKIPISYFLIEILSGLFALSIYLKFGLNPTALIYFSFIIILIIISFIDLKYKIIPDILSLPSIIIFFILSFFISSVSLKDILLGVLIGTLLFFLISYFYEKLTGKVGLGYGDVKLIAMIGALLGLEGVLFVILFSSFIGSFIGLILIFSNKMKLKTEIPFGPFLAIASILYIFWGDILIQYYFNIMDINLY